MRERLALLSFYVADLGGQLLRGEPGHRGRAGGLGRFCCFSASATRPPHPVNDENNLSFRTCPGYLFLRLPSHHWGRVHTKVDFFFFYQLLCANTQKNTISVSVPRDWPRSAWFARRDLQWPQRRGSLTPLLSGLQEVSSQETVWVNVLSTASCLSWA